jgi:hypothetical protein
MTSSATCFDSQNHHQANFEKHMAQRWPDDDSVSRNMSPHLSFENKLVVF